MHLTTSPLFSCRLCVRSGAVPGGPDLHTTFGVSHERACGGRVRGDRVAARWDRQMDVSCVFQSVASLFLRGTYYFAFVVFGS